MCERFHVGSTGRQDYDTSPYGRESIFLLGIMIFLSRESPAKRVSPTNARKNSTIGKSNQQFPPPPLLEGKHQQCMKTFMLFRAYAKNKKFHVTKDDKKKQNPAKKGKSFIGNFFFVLQCYQMS